MSDDRSQRFQRGAARIAAFASLSYAVDYSFQLVDIFWVARLGAGAPTAVAIASSALFLVLALNEVVGAGTVSLFAQTAGSGDRKRTGFVILQALFVKLVLGAVMALIFGAFMLWVAPRYDIDAAARGHLGAYGKVIWLSLLFVPVYSTMMTALRSLGGEADAARASALALLLNMVLNPLLIFGVGSWPGLGITGAAWATVFAQAVATMLAARALARNRFGARVFSAANLGWCPQLYRSIAIIGLPLGGVMILYNLEQAAVTAIAVSFGTSVSDGFGIGARICGFLFMAVFGIAVGASVTVGLHLGAERADVVRRALPRFAGVGTAAFGLVALPLAFFGEDLIGLFTQDAVSVAAGGTYLQFMAAALCLLCVHHVFNAAFEGAGRNMPVLFASAAMYLGVELPVVLVLAYLHVLTPEALWAAMTVTAAAGALFSVRLFHRGGWLAESLSQKRLQEDQAT